MPRGNKRKLAEYVLASGYYELSGLWKKELLSQTPHYIKLFEAVACCLASIKDNADFKSH